jgi:hypothetical protein
MSRVSFRCVAFVSAAVASAAWLLPALPAAEPLVAFPGAEGFGRFAKGGRSGDIYHVTTLDDSGPGSLRDAVKTKQADVPRTVVFDVGGTIKLAKPLRIENVNGLTLAGQTAPGGGIAVRDHGMDFRNCTDLVVRFMRFRLGDETKTSEDVINVGPEEGTCRDVTREKFLQPAEVVPEADRPVTHSAERASAMILERAGASLVRDAADERVIKGVKARTNRRIDSQKQVGGWPKLAAGEPRSDTDGDGMPDEWEQAHGLDPRDRRDGNAAPDGGYTNLERYLSELAGDRPAAAAAEGS